VAYFGHDPTWCFAFYQAGALPGSQSRIDAVMGGDRSSLQLLKNLPLFCFAHSEKVNELAA
jgi:hypothetical protein